MFATNYFAKNLKDNNTYSCCFLKINTHLYIKNINTQLQRCIVDKTQFNTYIKQNLRLTARHKQIEL